MIGTQRLAFDLWGDTVNVASRLQELAPPGRIVVGEGTMLLIRDAFALEPLGPTELRGHSPINTYAVVATGKASDPPSSARQPNLEMEGRIA